LPPARRCDLEALAQTDGCRIDRCDCGWIHVTVGTVTVRIRPSQCTELAAALAHATHVLAGEDARRMLC
jgi:hypothetical protein